MRQNKDSLEIHWHKGAAAALHQIENYIFRRFGEKTRQEFMDEVYQSVMTLAEIPDLGKPDPLFAHRKLVYRSIVVRKLNKIVYYVKNDIVHIAAVWDTRREPKNQANQTQE